MLIRTEWCAIAFEVKVVGWYFICPLMPRSGRRVCHHLRSGVKPDPAILNSPLKADQTVEFATLMQLLVALQSFLRLERFARG